MSIMVKININSVDGETYFGMAVPEHQKNSLLPFLEEYDHEGSNLLLQIYDSNLKQFSKELSEPEKIYNFLKS